MGDVSPPPPTFLGGGDGLYKHPPPPPHFFEDNITLDLTFIVKKLTFLTAKTIGFPGQISQILQSNFILTSFKFAQILSCRENYHSYSFSYHSI